MCCVVMIWHCKSSVFICWEWWAGAWGVMNAQWLGEGRNDLQRKKYHLPPGLCLGEIMFWLASLVFSSSLSPDLEGKCMMNLRTVAWIFSVPLILVYNNLMKNL